MTLSSSLYKFSIIKSKKNKKGKKWKGERKGERKKIKSGYIYYKV